jgi:hypothetical protein
MGVGGPGVSRLGYSELDSEIKSNGMSVSIPLILFSDIIPEEESSDIK